MTTRRLLLFAPVPILLALAGAVEAGVFRFTPKDYSYGPYDGGHHYSYATAYHYQLPFSSAHYPDPWNFPFAGGYYPEAYGWAERHSLRGRRHSVGIPADPPILYPVPAPPAEGCAAIELAVPAGAEVWIDDHKTAQTGTHRRFETPTIPKGKVFQYELRARWQQQGQAVEKSRTLFLSPGGSAQVVFP